MHSLFVNAGFRNVFQDSHIGYPTVFMEAVIAKQPDCVVILTHSLVDDSRSEQYRQYPRFENIPMIQLDQKQFTQPNLLYYIDSIETLIEWKQSF